MIGFQPSGLILPAPYILAGSIPANTVAPVITGLPTVGSTITLANAGTWTGSPSPTLTYQWRVNGSDVGGETGATFSTAGRANGNTIVCRVTATNSAGSAWHDSNTGTLAAPIAFVVGQNALGAAPANPAYLIGDLIIVAAGRTSNDTAPTVPAQFNSIVTNAGGGNNVGLAAGWRIATSDGADALGTWTNGQELTTLAYRNVHGIGAHPIATTQGSSLNVDWPAMTIGGINSWVLGYAVTRAISNCEPGTPAGFTPRTSFGGASYGSFATFDSGGVITSWAGEDNVDDAGASSANHGLMAIELLGATL